MAVKIPRGASDEIVDQIIGALEQFQADFPKSAIDIYRQNKVSVRIRIVEPEFKSQSKSERNKLVWGYLAKLPEEVQSDISTVLLLTPDEKKESFANFEFDDPVPSTL